MNFITFNPRNLTDADNLVNFYLTKNSCTYYILPMTGLSIFDFKDNFVDSFISMTDYSIYVKCTNPMYSLANDKSLIHGFHTSSDKDEEFYFLQFEIPEDYHQYFDYYKENQLRKFDPVALDLLVKAKILHKNSEGKPSYDIYSEPNEEQQKKNDQKAEIVYSLFSPLALVNGEVLKKKLYDIRLKTILDNEIMTEEEFFEKIVKDEIDLSQWLNLDKLDIENELKIYKWVSKYDFNPAYSF